MQYNEIPPLYSLMGVVGVETFVFSVVEITITSIEFTLSSG